MVNGIRHVAVVSKNSTLKGWYIWKCTAAELFMTTVRYTYFLQFADGSRIEFVTATDDKTADVEKRAGIRHLAFL